MPGLLWVDCEVPRSVNGTSEVLTKDEALYI
jgi:hypothetical protein